MPVTIYTSEDAGAPPLRPTPSLTGGTWTVAAVAAGTAAHYRIVDNAGTTCHEQGSVTLTGGGGDMTLDNTSIAAAQVVTITAKTLTAGGA